MALAERGSRVGNEQQSLGAERAPCDANSDGIDVDAVADHASRDLVVGEDRTDRPRPPMSERGHRVEQVGHSSKPSGLRPLQLAGRHGSVAREHDYAA